VFAAPATWVRLIRERGWRRPRQRAYPARQKEGIRATRPGELPDTFTALERLVSFYVSEHNAKAPHAAFHGQTPGQIYYGRGDDVPDYLAEARRHARQTRLENNRNLSGEACLTVTASLSPSESVASEQGEPQ